jgi:hypothetical protein
MPDIPGLEGLDEIQLAERAEVLLQNPLLVHMFVSLEQEIIEEWRAAKTPAERERAHAMLIASDRIQERLLSVVGAGEHARQTREAHKAFEDASLPKSKRR